MMGFVLTAAGYITKTLCTVQARYKTMEELHKPAKSQDPSHNEDAHVIQC